MSRAKKHGNRRQQEHRAVEGSLQTATPLTRPLATVADLRSAVVHQRMNGGGHQPTPIRSPKKPIEQRSETQPSVDEMLNMLEELLTLSEDDKERELIYHKLEVHSARAFTECLERGTPERMDAVRKLRLAMRNFIASTTEMTATGDGAHSLAGATLKPKKEEPASNDDEPG